MRDTGRERGTDTGRGRSSLHAGSLTWAGSRDSRIMSWAKGRCSTTEPPRRPPVSELLFILGFCAFLSTLSLFFFFYPLSTPSVTSTTRFYTLRGQESHISSHSSNKIQPMPCTPNKQLQTDFFFLNPFLSSSSLSFPNLAVMSFSRSRKAALVLSYIHSGNAQFPIPSVWDCIVIMFFLLLEGTVSGRADWRKAES